MSFSEKSSFLVCLFLAAGACKNDQLKKVLPKDAGLDSFVQTAASQIDVLWVVDNSGSMAPRQENLAKNFSAFIGEFSKASVDYRLAVASTDVVNQAGKLLGNPRLISPQTPNGAAAFSANIKVGTSGSAFESGTPGWELDLVLQSIEQEQAPARNAWEGCLALAIRN